MFDFSWRLLTEFVWQFVAENSGSCTNAAGETVCKRSTCKKYALCEIHCSVCSALNLGGTGISPPDKSPPARAKDPRTKASQDKNPPDQKSPRPKDPPDKNPPGPGHPTSGDIFYCSGSRQLNHSSLRIH